ncbi:hypothetical protein [Micromonospora sp. C95]|uniref:hypothetical protein n=1 Tax=Micromonospora sp. C95 TaxID=2824882 RepID=UPI001B371019|nr:hypothetical protein [Micromonospora sp. C95]MBQ1025547.1 hypothetical protein [Micromonospora sp. C95]
MIIKPLRQPGLVADTEASHAVADARRGGSATGRRPAFTGSTPLVTMAGNRPGATQVAWPFCQPWTSH